MEFSVAAHLPVIWWLGCESFCTLVSLGFDWIRDDLTWPWDWVDPSVTHIAPSRLTFSTMFCPESFGTTHCHCIAYIEELYCHDDIQSNSTLVNNSIRRVMKGSKLVAQWKACKLQESHSAPMRFPMRYSNNARVGSCPRIKRHNH